MNSSTSSSESHSPAISWRQFALRGLVFAALLAVSLWALQSFYDWSFTKGRFYKAQWVNSFQGERFDVAILGSSRSYVTIDARQMSEQTGLSVINLSLDGSAAADQLCLLKMFLDDNGNRVKRLLLQVDHWALGGPGSPESSYRVFLPFRKRDSVATTLRAAYPETGLPYRRRDQVPFLSYARCNAYWSVDKLVNSHMHLQRAPFDEFGSYLIDREFPEGSQAESIVSANFDPRFETIDEIAKLCESHDVQVYCFTSPWLKRVDRGGWSRVSEQLHQEFSNYRDFGDSFAGREDYFYDLSHLNRNGVGPFTKILSQWIIDSRTDAGSSP